MSIDVATDQPAGELLQRVEKVIDIIRPAIQVKKCILKYQTANS